jgi:hypothetical protein
VGVSCDVIGPCGLALGELGRAADEVGDAMVSRRELDRPVAGSGGEASLRERGVMRGGSVVGAGGLVLALLVAHVPHRQVAVPTAKATRTAVSASSTVAPARDARSA